MECEFMNYEFRIISCEFINSNLSSSKARGKRKFTSAESIYVKIQQRHSPVEMGRFVKVLKLGVSGYETDENVIRAFLPR